MNWTETMRVNYSFNQLSPELRTDNFLEDLDIQQGHLHQQVQNPCLEYFEPSVMCATYVVLQCSKEMKHCKIYDQIE